MLDDRPDFWELVEPVTWEGRNLSLTIAAHFITDLASIPRLVRNLLDVNGRSRSPAILHDWLYSGQWTTRSFADGQLRDALVAYGENEAEANVYWTGVRAGGWLPWWRGRKTGAGLKVCDFIDGNWFRLAQSMPPPIIRDA